jgi:hypothetical protein
LRQVWARCWFDAQWAPQNYLPGGSAGAEH